MFMRGYGAGRDPVFVCGCAGVASGDVQAIHRSLIRARYQVAVNVDRDLDRVVAHLVFHVGEGLTVLDEARGEGVPIPSPNSKR